MVFVLKVFIIIIFMIKNYYIYIILVKRIHTTLNQEQLNLIKKTIIIKS